MSKLKIRFVCMNCGFSLSKWEGCCPNCGKWNSLKETLLSDEKEREIVNENVEVLPLEKIKSKTHYRYDTGFSELNNLFGGGIVKGSISLIGGNPGIGKSTLLLQICSFFAKNEKVLYVSGEENALQIRLRAKRLKINSENLLLLIEFNVDTITSVMLKERPSIVVVDSIQTTYCNKISSMSGSIAQIRECTYIFQKIAKKENITIILVGHVNKEGNFAGPKILEHIVDCVLYFEGDSKNSFRILRVVKNRFGSVNEIAIFDMKDEGLVSVVNPSAILIEERPKNVSGSCICAIMNGKRPIFVEIQALVTKTGFGLARRLTKGLDYNKLIIIIAVLEKRFGFFFQNLDCYVNVVGGFKLEDPSCDLAVCLALVAAVKNLSLDEEMVVLGEIGLAGEVRGVFDVERIILEAEKLGFKKVMLPRNNLKNLKLSDKNITLIGVENVKTAVSKILK